MPISLLSTPNTFMRLMNHLIKKYLRKFVVVYSDDIIIYHKSIKKHFVHLRRVFNTLKERKLCRNRKKSSFFQPHVVFLSYAVTSNKTKVDEEKDKAIRKWPLPSSVS